MSDDRYGDIRDEQRIDVELEGELAAEISVRFEGEDLEALLWAMRELDIGPTDEFARRAVLSAIERQRMRLNGAWEGDPGSGTWADSPLIEPPARDMVTRTIGPDVQVAQVATGPKASLQA